MFRYMVEQVHVAPVEPRIGMAFICGKRDGRCRQYYDPSCEYDAEQGVAYRAGYKLGRGELSRLTEGELDFLKISGLR